MCANITVACTLQFTWTASVAYLDVALGFIILCENVFGMVTIWRTPDLHTNANRFIFSLALADICVAIAFILVSGYGAMPELKSTVNNIIIIDILLFGINVGMIGISCIHMAVIAVDRYIYIIHPFYYMRRMTKARILKIIFCIWIAGIIYTLSPLLLYNSEEYLVTCIISSPPMTYYISSAVGYVVLLAAVFVCYFKIAHLAFKRKKAAAMRRLNTSNVDNVVWNRKNRTAMMKSVKFFAVMFGVFFICTSIPGMVVGLNRIFDISDYYYILQHLYLLNSAANFVIYAYMCKDFYQALKATFTDLKRCFCCL